MQKITLKKEGIFFSFWEESTASWVDRNINEVDLPFSWYLPYSVKIDGHLTVCDILKNLESYKNEVQVIFANALGGIPIDDFYRILKEEPEKKISVPINCTYLFKIGEVSPMKDEDIDYLSTYPVIMGLMITDSENEESAYHLSPYDVRGWCGLEIGMDAYIEYTDVENEEVVLNGLTKWMLFEVLHTILSQMSLSMRVTSAAAVKEDKRLSSGPMVLDELFAWMDELDRILLV